MSSLYRLDVIVRGNSTILQDKAIEWAKNWVNNRQEDSTNKTDGGYLREYYADLYDSRTNQSWKVFSDVATKNRGIENVYVSNSDSIIKGIIYTSPFFSGLTNEVVIDNSSGSKRIDVKNNNAKIFLQVEDNLKAIARVENQDSDGFDIVLYDGEYYDEDKVRLDCSNEPVRVNYLLIY